MVSVDYVDRRVYAGDVLQAVGVHLHNTYYVRDVRFKD